MERTFESNYRQLEAGCTEQLNYPLSETDLDGYVFCGVPGSSVGICFDDTLGSYEWLLEPTSHRQSAGPLQRLPNLSDGS